MPSEEDESAVRRDAEKPHEEEQDPIVASLEAVNARAVRSMISSAELALNFRGALAPAIEAMARMQKSMLPAIEQFAKLQRPIVATEQFARLQRSMNQQLAKLGKSMLPAIEKFAKLQLQRITMPALENFVRIEKDFLRSVANIGKSIQEHWVRAMPGNWRELEATKVGTVIDLMETTGLGLVWIPRESVLEKLLLSPPEEAYEIILREEQVILDDSQGAMDEVTAHELVDIRNATEAALIAYLDGHHWTAQALAAATLTEMIEVHIEMRLSHLRREYERLDVMEEGGPLREIRLLALFVAMARSVLAPFDRAAAIPSTFNRHASLHTVAPSQYTRGNSLSALLLLGSLAREIQEWTDGSEPST